MKVKEVKIPHLMNKNKKKLEAWGLGGLFAADWSQAHEELVKELSGHSEQKVVFPKYECRGKSEAWTSEVWREVYNLPKASPGGYVMRGKVQFTELQLLKLMKGNKWAILAPVRLEHFQHNQLAFYHYAWLAIMDPTLPTPDWGDAIEKTITRQVKALGVCNKPTCLGPYLAHLSLHYNELQHEKMEEPKKRKARDQSISNSETEAEEEKKMEESPNATWIGEASRSRLLDTKTAVNFNEWEILLHNLGWDILRLFEILLVNVKELSLEEVACNLERFFAPPPAVESVDL
ncbi:hypothetical protein R1flu_021494 [Riccia fluitans]|uniref:Uncharacterized protein n=1 Tax=Riccia fluitans TaxID=41844 RepID=A0ABD1ZR99_9MARC